MDRLRAASWWDFLVCDGIRCGMVGLSHAFSSFDSAEGERFGLAKKEDKWFGSTRLGESLSGVVARVEVEKVMEPSDSLSDEPYMLGALNARTLVVDKSSSGADIALRLMVPALLMLAARLGSKRDESDIFLLRVVNARASSMTTS